MRERVGIVGYGAYVPRYRIAVEEIASTWGWDASAFKKGLAIEAKAVAPPDHDAVTLAVEAAHAALKRAGCDPKDIGAVYVGSESHPYAVKPTGTIVAEALGATPWVRTADLEFACKAGTEALGICIGLARSGEVRYALAIGSDTSQGAPGDPLEFATSAGAAAFIVGAEDHIAIIEAHISYVTDTSDFWRREGQRFPRHGGRFTGAPAYFHHIVSAAKKVMEETGHTPSDFAHAVFHQPNGKFPARVGRMLGFSHEQLRAGLLSPRIGNVYSASSLLGLCAALDASRPGERILLVSYGSGAGSDAFVIRATDRISEVRPLAPTVEEILSRPTVHIDYARYARFRNKISREVSA